MSPSIPISRFVDPEEVEPSPSTEPTAEPLKGLAAVVNKKAGLPVAHSDGVMKALPPLKPCPFCGEALVDKSGKWYGHRDEASECWESAARIRDEVDAYRWNARSEKAWRAPVPRPLMAPNGLEPKQELFVTEYMKDRNATQAAIRAGYSRKTARQMGAENFAKPVIRAEINRRIEEYSRTAGISRVECLQRLDAITRADIRKLFAPGGGILPPDQWPEDAKLVVKGYNRGNARRGAKIEFVSRVDIMFKLLDEIRPLEEKWARARDKRERAAERSARRRIIDVTPVQ